MLRRGAQLMHLHASSRVVSPICLVVLFSLSSCARVSGSESSLEPGSDAQSNPPAPSDTWEPPDLLPKWDESPLIGAIDVASEAEAASYLPFPPVIPENLGTPVRISVLAADPDPSVAALGLVYDHAEFGPFWVTERLAQTTQAGLELSAAGCTAATGCQARATMVTITGGIRAKLLEGPVANSIKWLQGEMFFDIIGPAQSFHPTDLTEVADLVTVAAE